MKELQASLIRKRQKMFLTHNCVANLIVAARARAAGIHISLWTYGRAGNPLTLLTLALGA